MEATHTFCNHQVIVKYGNVYDMNNNWLGYYFVDETGYESVLGPNNKGHIVKINN